MPDHRWTPYYTPQQIAGKILKFIPQQFNPQIVIDICAGSGNFLNSAFNTKWSKAKYYAFDALLNESVKTNSKWKLVEINSLQIEKLKSYVPLEKRKLVLANPPFGHYLVKLRNTRNTYLSSLLIAANKTNRIEAKMIYANLSLMKTGDIFAAILPENIFSSETFQDFKKLFLEHFKVLKLGRAKRYFKGCEVRTRIFVGVFSRNPIKTANKRPALKASGLEIFRGVDNSKLKSKKDKRVKNLKEVLHFNNTNGQWTNKKFFKIKENTDQMIIESNDLLIIRVGRNTGKIFIPKPNYIGKLCSDYFFLVKNYKISQARCRAIEERLKTSVKGLTTNYLVKIDVESTLIRMAA